MSLYSSGSPGKSVALSDIVQGLGCACELTRPLTSSIPALLTGVVVVTVAKSSPATALRGAFAMGISTMAGFLFDNIYDLSADRAADHPTPLTQGIVSSFQARMLAGILALCAILLSPAGALGKLTLSATLLALWFYSYAAHSVPWFKNVYSALLVCLPLLYGSLIAGVSVPLAYYFVLGLFVLGRESLIDAHQADDDRQAGFRTLPILLGRRATEVCGTVVVDDRGSAADLPCARHNRAPGGWVVRGCNCSSIGYAAAGDPTYRVVAHPNGNWGGCDRIVSVTPPAPEKLSPPNIGSPMYVRTMFRARYILCGL